MASRTIFQALVSIILLVVIGLPVNTASAFAPAVTVAVNNGNTITLVYPDAMTQGDIPLSINGISGCGVRVFIFDLSWNPNVIRVTSFSPTVYPKFNITHSVPYDGALRIEGYTMQGAYLTGNATIGTLAIEGIGDPGDETTIQVTTTELLDCQGNAIPALPVSADVEITCDQTTTFYRDADSDTYGDPAVSVKACSAPAGYVSNNTDCNDASASVNPGMTEITCNGIDDDCNPTTFDNPPDADGDGITVCGGDCNDSDNTVYPGAPELCNGIDDDCDGVIDNGLSPTTFYRDADSDTYGDPAVTVSACAAPAGYVSDNTDCNDANASVHPLAAEVCNGLDDDCNNLIDEGFDADGDGYTTCENDCNDSDNTVYPDAPELCDDKDNDCDGDIDEGCCPELITFFRDSDGDTYGDPAVSVKACSAPAGYVSDNTDCNDANASVHPLAAEVCNGLDDDCNNLIDEGFDADGDGYTTCENDCNDSDNTVYPDAPELCDDKDNDCDGDIDEGCCPELITFFRDSDGDTYGDPAVSVKACSAPAGYVSDNTDCNDANASVHPLAAEVCNGLDDDCNNLIDEGFDADGDGYTTCENDCNDSDNTVYPDAPELCDDKDNDCDGDIDEGCCPELITFFRDSDGDTYGDPAVSVKACSAPAGYVSDNTDCNDANASVHPLAAEVCNGLDDDCNNLIDEGFDADGDGYTTCENDCNDSDNTVYPDAPELCDDKDNDCDGDIDEGCCPELITFFRDSDGDTYGDPAVSVKACSAPAGYVSDNTDCNDANASVHPLAAEVCNGLDDDCNNLIDEGFDADGDGYTTCENDCNDSDNTVYPDAPELCDDKDNDCDGDIDEGCCPELITFFRDSDGDTYGDPAVSVKACSAPAGYVSDNTDCNDANASVHPLAAEVCNGLDDDCNNLIDEGFDADGDGYTTCENDCNDSDNTVYPDAPELCDDKDNDCDGDIDEGCCPELITFFRDSDGDTYGDPAVSVKACSAPAGYVSDNTDCNDANASVHPLAAEVCNGLDDDCNNLIDEGFDADGDGYTTCENDCNDSDNTVYPDAPELCDDKDNDCDGDIDEGCCPELITFFRDSDGDTYGDPAVSVKACSAPAGYVSDNTDCNDANASVHPLAAEVCNGLDDDCNNLIDEGFDADGDGYTTCENDCNDSDNTVYPDAPELCDDKDNDCDGDIDEGCCPELITFFRDSDGDTYGDPAVSVKACSAPAGYVSNNTDCNDANASVHPLAAEVCNGLDDDCNNLIDEGFDADGDGYTTCENDCNDSDNTVYPDAPELCDDKDNDCDGDIDEGCCPELITFFRDSDGDTYGDPAVSVKACSAPAGYVSNNTDCNDANASVHPLAAEVCNGLDDDCNNLIDEGFDADGDGYTTCENDCNDSDNTVYPDAPELCDDKDNDCDGDIDEGCCPELITFFRDSDGDTYGDPAVSVKACSAPAGYVSNNTDCNDANASVHPLAAEVCNGLDDDCNNLIDEGFDADADGFTTCGGDCDDSDPFVYPGAYEYCDSKDNDCDGDIDEGCCPELITFFRDSDGDTYGDPAVSVKACSAPAGYVSDNTDCNDANASVHPLAAEVCNGLDDDCNNLIDEGFDADGDGYTTCENDCNDSDNTVYPDAPELCDDKDNDCDGDIDEGCCPELITFFRDSDGDTYGDPAVSVKACSAPAGYVSDNTDCNDANASVHPLAAEVCNGLDDDCNNLIDEGFDADGDGYTTCENDCNDSDNTVYPDAPELCDDKDNDCDGDIDEGCCPELITFFRDSDGDTYGDPAVSVKACSAPAGYVSDNTDCNDANASVHPLAAEVCNGLDDDCNNLIDEGFDADGDGYTTCENDCNDSDNTVYPDAPELCDDKDNDCDGDIDEGCCPELITFFRDSDGDTYGDPAVSVKACSAPAGYVSDNTDCNDANASVHPLAAEVCNGLDDDCNNLIDEGFDADGDGYTTCENDCNDSDNTVYPDAPELCDDKDNDCDGDIDEGCCPELITFFRDSDGDTYGDPAVSVKACSAPAGYVSDNTDCNDANASVHPLAAEVCNGLDDDCNNLIDEGFDADGDGYTTCENDCNDSDNTVYPDAPELCDDKDNDCDGDIDEGCCPELITFFRDSDGDTYGDPAVSVKACSAPAGYVFDNTDCNDANASVHPLAAEVCNGLDDDCNNLIDEGFDADGDGYTTCENDCNDSDNTVYPDAPELCDDKDNDCDGDIDEGCCPELITFFRDSDGDTYGDPAVSVKACSAPAGYVSDNTDCNDANASVHPLAAEVCNGLDDDCNNLIDEGFDADGDGYTTCENDCNDSDNTVYPDAPELCDDKDNDCDGDIDEGCCPELITFFRDSDGDTYGDPAVSVKACSAPAGYVSDNTDCNDANASVHPLAAEVCNGLDDDCNNLIDEGFDADGDGYTTCENDCNDSDNTVYPDAPELCDDKDNDCDGDIDEGCCPELITFFRDSDGDTYGDPAVSVKACSAPAGYVSDNTDCNDANASVHPLAAEVCNGLDDDCNNLIDEGFDADGDGYTTCENDCNDSDNTVYPDAPELCDDKDNDCDGDIDEGCCPELITFFRDSDGDTYGDPAVSVKACSAPAGYVSDNTDCNDANASVHPLAAEVCNGLDDDCNNLIDEGFDADGDGYTTCENDCNDSDNTVYPDAPELCDDKDNDCDGDIDEGCCPELITFFRDSDGDTYGDPAVSVKACSAPAGYVSNNTDCNDNNANVNPGKVEVPCNGIDDDCNPATPDDQSSKYYRDADGDGYGNPNEFKFDCAQPAGYVANNTDCDDTKASVHPGAAETCNNIDDDCDASVDEGLICGGPIDQYYTLTITVTPTNGGTTNPTVGSYSYLAGTTVNISATANTGYEFVNWTGDTSGTSPTTSVIMNGNRTVTANFSEITTYSLTILTSPSQGGTTNPLPGFYAHVKGTVVEIEATPAEGWQFVNWSGDASGTATTTSVVMDRNRTVTANFTRFYTLTITASPTEGGLTTPVAGSYTYEQGSIVPISATPTDEWTFVNWTGDAGGSSQVTSIIMDSDKAVTANFTRFYTLTIGTNPEGSGTTSPATGSYSFERGTAVSISATPAEGFAFTGWTGDAVTANATTTVTMDANKSVVANFSTAAVTYTLIIETTGEGSTEPEPGPHSYAAGAMVAIDANPADGWGFVNWTADNAADQAAIADADSPATTVTMNGNHIITANFQEAGGDGGPTNVPLIAGAIVAALAAAGGFFFFLLGKRRKKKKNAAGNA